MAAQNYVLLERIELNGSATSVTFSNIPQSGYTDLKVVFSGRIITSGPDSNPWTATGLQLNSTNPSSQKQLYGTGSAAGSDSNTSPIFVTDTNATSSTYSSGEIYIPNYTSSNQKSVSIDVVTENNATAAVTIFWAGLYNVTTSVNSVTFTGSTYTFDANSTFSLYGLAAVGTTPVIAPKASGGNITTDGTYWIHTFLTTGAFVPQTNLSCDVLVVAGGGSGGGSDIGGGGGGGGFRTATAQSVTATSYTVTVGAGGASVGTTAALGNSGSSSTFNTITSAGGGGGGRRGGGNFGGVAGGSGGGGGGVFSGYTTAGGAGNTPSTSPSQGNNGGNGFPDNGGLAAGGGGGGAGAAAANATSALGSAGGNGSASSITGTSVTYAGGGGGAAGSTAAAGGTGGGGAAGSNGVTNTGGGGGGSASGWGFGGSGSGGSGIVIIRYPIA